ncbi:rhodanese-like domain-containing protein [Marinicrinis lubricantis]|uniref:Rhodanese-like domain-containing protein n=1 Tax=Marinicrinis lubricantis TaxID=2086470 RepID=A0ABW1ILS6_9BACL
MGIIQYIMIAFVVIWLVLRFMPVKGVRQISAAELKQELGEKNKQYIDVRTPGEYQGGHIRGFSNMPLHQLTESLSSLSKEKEVVVICQSGMRSQKACSLLRKHGFHQITNVRGGMSAWRG